MTLLMTLALFILLVAFITAVGMKMWARPKEAMERVAGMLPQTADRAPVHPSLLFREMIKRFGTLLPASPKDVTVMQRRLMRAGFRNASALKYLYGAKALLGVLLPVLASAYVA